jgi:hypothetical protein
MMFYEPSAIKIIINRRHTQKDADDGPAGLTRKSLAKVNRYGLLHLIFKPSASVCVCLRLIQKQIMMP